MLVLENTSWQILGRLDLIFTKQSKDYRFIRFFGAFSKDKSFLFRNMRDLIYFQKTVFLRMTLLIDCKIEG